MSLYEESRLRFKPQKIKRLLIAESPPPEGDIQSSRHFYRSEKTRHDDRLFINTIKALYSETTDKTEAELEQGKAQWLRRFQSDGWYMIEALETSLEHEVTKKQRQDLIKKNMHLLIDRVRKLANKDTKIILIKSNVFEVVVEPLRQAGFNVLNKELLDYPGHFSQRAYREKLANLSQE